MSNVRRVKSPADFSCDYHHIHFTALDMPSPMVSNTAAHTKADAKLAS